MTLSPDTRDDSTLRPQPIRHDGSCGERIFPPCDSRALAPFKAAEQLPNLTVLCHQCGLTWRPSESVWCGRGRRSAA